MIAKPEQECKGERDDDSYTYGSAINIGRRQGAGVWRDNNSILVAFSREEPIDLAEGMNVAIT